MITITGRNVNDIFPVGLMIIREQGVLQPSRNGATLELPQPFSIQYQCPLENVLFDPVRRINPFLHFFEPLWILAGRDDVKFMKAILPSFIDYSDDGIRFYGAYGHRMRACTDQVAHAILNFRKNKEDRRNVLAIRQGHDITYTGRDMPCNVSVALLIRDNKLHIHVFNRSNDYLWGMLGTNAVQFAVLMEYIAGYVGCDVGSYHQTSNCAHVYVDSELWKLTKDTSLIVQDPYAEREVYHYPMMNDPEGFEWDLEKFFSEFDFGVHMQDGLLYCTTYFREVVVPMWNTLLAHRTAKEGLDYVEDVRASDWYLVTKRWLEEKK